MQAPKNQHAFPANHFDMADNEHGMTLRDYFAAKAMQGFLSASLVALANKHKDEPSRVNTTISGAAYELADAMLKEREK